MNTITTLFAQAPAPAPAPGGALGGFVPLVLLFAIFYFLLIRPQQRKEKERKAQVAALRAGARVVFCGGMLGTIEEVRPATFLVRLSEGATVEVLRGAVEAPAPEAPAAGGKTEARQA